MTSTKLSPILFEQNKFPQINQTISNINSNIDIEYNIPLIKFNGLMGGTIKEVTDKFINMIEAELISKHPDCTYYIYGESDDYMPSPFSNSNTIKFIVPNIFYNIVTSNRNKFIFKIRIFSNSKKFDFFDTVKYPTYVVEIINLNN